MSCMFLAAFRNKEAKRVLGEDHVFVNLHLLSTRRQGSFRRWLEARHCRFRPDIRVKRMHEYDERRNAVADPKFLMPLWLQSFSQ